MPVKLLELKGGLRHLVEKLGVESPEVNLNEDQKSLRRIAVMQNFCHDKPARPSWAKDAFVYVTVDDAANLEQAVKESGIELKSRHVLVSDDHLELLKAVISAPAIGTGREAYQRGRAGAVASEVAVPTATFAIDKSRSESLLGPLDIIVGDMHLICKHTFLDLPQADSVRSRQTRSTGDRPKRANPPVEMPGADRLPPVDADYGPQRKNFHLLSATASPECEEGVDLGSDLYETASCTSVSLASEASAGSYMNMSQYFPELNEKLKFLNKTSPPPRVPEFRAGTVLPPFAAAFLQDRVDLFLDILKRALESDLHPKDVAALSAFEDHEEQVRASSSVFDVLEKRIRSAIGICHRCLQLKRLFFEFREEDTVDKFKSSLNTAVNERLSQFRRSVQNIPFSPEASPLDVLRTGVWKAVHDVMQQCLGRCSLQHHDEGQLIGTMKSSKDSFGFIEGDMGEGSLFFHFSEVAPDSHLPRKGDRVTFSLNKFKRGKLQATKVRLLLPPAHVLMCAARVSSKHSSPLYLDSDLLPPDEEEEDDRQEDFAAGGSYNGEPGESDQRLTWEEQAKEEKAEDKDEEDGQEDSAEDTGDNPEALFRGGADRARGRGRGGIPRNRRHRR